MRWSLEKILWEDPLRGTLEKIPWEDPLRESPERIPWEDPMSGSLPMIPWEDPCQRSLERIFVNDPLRCMRKWSDEWTFTYNWVALHTHNYLHTSTTRLTHACKVGWDTICPYGCWSTTMWLESVAHLPRTTFFLACDSKFFRLFSKIEKSPLEFDWICGLFVLGKKWLELLTFFPLESDWSCWQ